MDTTVARHEGLGADLSIFSPKDDSLESVFNFASSRAIEMAQLVKCNLNYRRDLNLIPIRHVDAGHFSTNL